MAAPSIPVPMSILVIDDDADIRQSLQNYLSDRGHHVHLAEGGHQGLEILQQESIDIVISDVSMPGIDGFEILSEVQRLSPSTEVIIITGIRQIENAFRAMREGAFDFFTKPLKVHELSASLQRTLRFRALRQEKDRLERLVAGPATSGLAEILGESDAIRQVREQVLQVSQSDAVTVLIQGETGTGKELVARAIHAESARADRPFVAVNCSALPESLIESEFYGYVKGAFTGAQDSREGYFERAHGGTLFLDEIGDMALSMQTRLLRTLGERCIQRLGDTREIAVDIRVLSATHQDLLQAIAANAFRADLFYRLNTVTLRVPSLQERPEDILPLAEHFLRLYAGEIRKPLDGFTSEAADRLRSHPFHGNVRELRNTIERAVLFGHPPHLVPDDLALRPLIAASGAAIPATIAFDPSTLADLNLAECEKALIREALHRSGSLSGASRLLNITREMLRTRMKNYGIPTP